MKPIVPCLIFPLMLILPLMALFKVNEVISFIYVIAYLLIISVITAMAYRSDKRKAESETWRIPERTLHLYEFLGGWVAAFISQRVFRHKISKKTYQFEFWFIAAIHQGVAFDYLQNWKFAVAAFNFIESIFK